MDSRPLVSVVMCSFNSQEDFFREAIESVHQQTYSDWELLIIDNGSTNGSDAVAREYAEKFPKKIRYLEHPNRENKGPAASRNLGIREASGDYIAFLDSDDFWVPEKLKNQMAAMLAHPSAALSFCGIMRWYGWDKSQSAPDAIEQHTEELEILQPPELICRFLRNECIPGMSSLMVRKDASTEVGGFEESLLWAEDQTIAYKIALKHVSLILPGWDMKYRQHPHSTTTGVVATGRVFSDHLRFLDWVQSHFKKVGVQNDSLWEAFRLLRREYQWIVFKASLVPTFVKNALRRLRRKKSFAPTYR